uniref:Uncharacterized protein n=1 Tax=Ciona intestinalis TaxID=7719 RepID=H2XYQ0_CIOIN
MQRTTWQGGHPSLKFGDEKTTGKYLCTKQQKRTVNCDLTITVTNIPE